MAQHAFLVMALVTHANALKDGWVVIAMVRLNIQYNLSGKNSDGGMILITFNLK